MATVERSRGGASTRSGIAVVAAVAAAVAPLLPFATSGSRVRSGYELVRTAASAGVLEGTVGRTAIVALAALPLLAAGAFAAASLRRPVVVATLAVMAGLVAGGVGLAVRLAPVTAEAGTSVAMAAGLCCLGTAGALAARGGR